MMKKNKIVLSVLLSSILGASCTYAADASTAFKWPKGQKAAVSLSYDDALDSQLDHAIPTLNKYGLKGTFYLQLSSPTIDKRLPEWRAAAKKGHELGNHSLFHQCAKSKPGRDWVEAGRDLDKLTVAQMKDQVVLANTVLYAIDGKRDRTFTAPCVDKEAGGQNYINAVKSEFVAIKLESGGVTPDMNKLDPYAVGVAFPANVTGQQLIDIVKEAAEKGTMANFTFHGVGGDHLSVSAEAHEELIKYLAKNKNIYWVDTFVNEMKYVKAHQQK
ncbi:chitooligosaccharide deacetylase [Cellvibrio zantedeschiae]|uniref:Chitooligosaccharide deacetylase n=2 Tax=Cellvibrio zantedeschiae TaxID=1237077 RepID=A0ABQ3B3C6_9GAMM|nr:chitooligosaccharide deacetylase [Cellvibrio zantedeschiae]